MGSKPVWVSTFPLLSKSKHQSQVWLIIFIRHSDYCTGCWTCIRWHARQDINRKVRLMQNPAWIVNPFTWMDDFSLFLGLFKSRKEFRKNKTYNHLRLNCYHDLFCVWKGHLWIMHLPSDFVTNQGITKTVLKSLRMHVHEFPTHAFSFSLGDLCLGSLLEPPHSSVNTVRTHMDNSTLTIWCFYNQPCMMK